MRAASAPAESLPARSSTEPKPAREFVRQQPAQSERAPTRRFKPTPETKADPKTAANPATGSAASSAAKQAPEANAPAPKPISNDEALKDPLVQSVIEVFGGEIKRVHPKAN